MTSVDNASAHEANVEHFPTHAEMCGWEMVSKKQSNITEYSRILLV